MRSLLDGLYRWCGTLAGVCLALIAVLVLAQIGGRLFGVLVPAADDFAGYSMAASLFLALAHTFRAGGHVRISLVVERLRGRPRRWIELWSLAGAAALIGYFTWFVGDMTWDSFRFGDRSQGMVATPLWMPQSVLAVGLAVLFVCLVDEFVHVARGGAPRYGEPAAIPRGGGTPDD
ncbi:MAG: TRAP transporter small permease [Pseudomonadota bacterium]